MASALVRALLNRLLTVGAVFAGLGLVVVGLVLGFGDAVGLAIENPTDPGAAFDRANPVLFLAFVVLGFVVWQVGKAYAQARTAPGSAGARGADVDPELLESIDERLTKIEANLEETHRGVQRLQRGDRAATFDEGEALGSSTPESSGAMATTGSGSATARAGADRASSTDREESARAGDVPTGPTSGEAMRSADSTTAEGASAREEGDGFDFGETHSASGTDDGGDDRSVTGKGTAADDESDPLP